MMPKISEYARSKLNDPSYLNTELLVKQAYEVSNQLGVDVTTLYKYCKKLGINTSSISTDIRIMLEDREYLFRELSKKSMTKVANQLGISRTALKKYVNIHQINVGSLPSNLLTKLEDREWLLSQTNKKTLTEIGKDLGVSKNTISKYCHSHGITTRSREELPEETIQKLNDPVFIKEYLIHSTIADMAKSLRVSRAVAQNYCTKNSISRPRLSDNAKEILGDPEKLAKKVDVSSLSHIADDIGVNPTTVANYCRKYDIPIHNFPKETMEKLLDGSFLQAEINTKSVSTIAVDLGVSINTIFKYSKVHDIKFPKSGYENEIASWLSAKDIRFNQNTRKIISPFEIDFYLPDFKMGIEFNGLYWHNDKNVDKNYHRMKYERCKEIGVSLFMINEDEWKARSDVIKSTILHRLGLGQKGFGARQLTISKISGAEANNFFTEHHIQGATSSSIIYANGGFVEGNLVCAMAFNKQRGTGATELIRFCSDGRSHAGAFSRLFHHSIKQNNFDEIISFADLRYSEGNVYHHNGFDLVDEIKPDYRYVVNGKAVHKSNFTKKRIADRFGVDMTSMTEREAMEQLGFARIYDCGKLKFLWKN